MKSLSLKSKLIFSFLLVGLIPMLCMGVYSYIKSSANLKDQAVTTMTTIRHIKEKSIKNYFKEIENKIIIYSDNLMIIHAMKDFKTAALENNSENEQAITYQSSFDKYHPSINQYKEIFGFDDIYLVDIKSGNILYSSQKKSDFSTSLISGPYSETNIGESFQQAKALENSSAAKLVDFKPYPPNDNSPESFIATPISFNGTKIGVLIFQISIDKINTLMNDRSGMGKTGESYLFGPDKLMRSDSFLNKENFSVKSSFEFPKKGILKTKAALAALDKKTGTIIAKNYLFQDVISSYSPINILGLNWGLITEVSTHEAFSSIESLKVALLSMLVGICLIIIFFAFLMSSSLSNKIHNITVKLLEGAKEVVLSSGSISGSSKELSDAAIQQASSLQETVSSIDEISSMIQKNADAANSSAQVSLKSTDVASKGKSTVEEMITSINEISNSNDDIMKEMQKNNQDFSKIVTVISEIGEKTKVINDIVFQTKLLSFNASVEAARAGEHGKGFSVVAEEVGNLAAMSGKAALEITEMLDQSIKQVTEIVDSTKTKVETLVAVGKTKVEQGTKTAKECGDSLDEILHNVSSVNEMVREISSASAEQSTGVKEVTKAMQQLDQTTHQNTSVAQESSSMAEKLKDQGDSLNSAVEDLIYLVSGKKELPIKPPKRKKEKKKKENKEHKEHSNLKSEERVDNVLTMPQKKEKLPSVAPMNEAPIKEEKIEIERVKVSGLDTMIPSENDPRFEDL